MLSFHALATLQVPHNYRDHPPFRPFLSACRLLGFSGRSFFVASSCPPARESAAADDPRARHPPLSVAAPLYRPTEVYRSITASMRSLHRRVCSHVLYLPLSCRVVVV